MAEQDPPEAIARVEVTGELDPHAVEAIRLEIRRLARRHGVEVKECRQEATDP